MVIERGGAFVEAARVPGIAKSKTVEVQMMAELMTESAQKRSERGDLFANGRSHPDPDQAPPQIRGAAYGGVRRQAGKASFATFRCISSAAITCCARLRNPCAIDIDLKDGVIYRPATLLGNSYRE
jgi:hypothetical protein